MKALRASPVVLWGGDPSRSRERRQICKSQSTSASKDNSKFVTTGVVKLPEGLSVTPSSLGEELPFGVAAAQGGRGTMEDEAVVFPEGKCGFLYASNIPPPLESLTTNGCLCSGPGWS